MSDYVYPATLIKKTEKRIHDQIKGNGLDSKSVSIQILRQGEGVFTARTGYNLDVKIEARSVTGKVVEGRLVPAGQLQGEITKITQQIKAEKSTRELIESLIRKLPQHGFGADKQILDLPPTKQSLTEHQNCSGCGGRGQMQCHTCHGQTRIQCQQCFGMGDIQCLQCQGRGQTPSYHDTTKMQICTQCQGRGRSYCTQCQGQKTIPCTSCQGKGQMACTQCQGAGITSHIATIKAFAVTSAQIHLHELDPEPKRFASIVTPERLANGEHMTITLTKPPQEEEEDRAWYENKPERDTSGVYYRAVMPWAAGHVLIKDRVYEIGFTGSKGAVVDCKPFMDDVLKKPRALLAEARQSRNTAELLKEACSYRVSRETLSAVAKGQKKRAMQTLLSLYSVGLSKPAIQDMVLNGFHAIKRITRTPRYTGMAIGLVLSGYLAFLWFQYGLRDIGINQTANIRHLLDLSIFITATALAFLCVKIAGFISLKSVMKIIGLQQTKIPAAGMAGIYALLGSAVLWGGMFALLLVH